VVVVASVGGVTGADGAGVELSDPHPDIKKTVMNESNSRRPIRCSLYIRHTP